MGLLFLTSYAMVCVLLSCCLGCYFLSYCVQSFYSLCAGYGGLCLMLISSGIVLLVIMFLFFVLCFGCCWFSNSFDKWVWYFLWLTPFICVCVDVCLRHWITYLILLCFYVDVTCVCLCLESISLKHFIFWMLCLTAMCSILGVYGFHWSFILMFYACSYLMWSYLCYQSLMFECSQSVHIMVMVDCLIDSYF